MLDQRKTELDRVFERLVLRNEQTGRELADVMGRLGLGSDGDIERALGRLHGRDEERRAVERWIANQLADGATEPSWTELSSPPFNEVYRRFGSRLIRV